MKLIYVVLLLVCIGIIIPVTIVSLYQKPVEVQSIPYHFVINNSVSINLDTNKFYLGGSIPGSSLERAINISTRDPGRIVIRSEGPGSMQVSENNFYLEKNSYKEVNFTLIIPDSPIGEYEGMIYVERYEK